MLKPPSEWTDDDRDKVRRAIADHRLIRADLFFWQALDIEGRTAHDLSLELLLTVEEVLSRVEQARERLRSALERPSQEAYLGRWVNT